MEDRLPRKLTAILYADVAGYSRLTGEDEEGTHRRLRTYLELMSNEIARHEGRVVHYAGDAVLADFGTVTDALKCAICVQRRLLDENRDLPEARKVEFRIGINLGEVIVDRDDIYGDGVNVAARLEGLASPGSVCVSESVRSAIGSKLDVDYEYMGEQPVKNIKEPVRAYQVKISSGETSSPLSFKLPELVPPSEPSIAVLPFTNMSGDPEQEYFSDGISEDIITALSKISGLMVVARNSTFIYKGKAVEIRQVAQDQGVRYVLEGSVRKASNRVRVTAQLIDTETGYHLWAERYDRSLEDIFAVQDEITREVVVALDVQLRGGEQARIWSSGTKNLEAWECVRLGMDLLNRGNPESPLDAQRLCERALELDPNYAMAWVTLGWTHHHRVDVGVGHLSKRSRESELNSALDCGNRALALDPTCADAYALVSFCHLSKHEFDLASETSQKAVSLAPRQAEILALSAVVDNKTGRPRRSMELIKKAMRFCPIYPSWFLAVLGTAYRLTGEIESAITAFKEAIERNSDFLSQHVNLASTLGELGRKNDAQKYVAEIYRLDPDFSIRNYMAGLSYSDPSVLDRFEHGLREAGLPE